jgi:LysM repeat protein
MTKKKTILLFFAALFFTTYTFAQSEVIYDIIDTVKSGDFQIILYENQTWEYINHDSVVALKMRRDSAALYDFAKTHRLIKLDSLTIFSEKWDTINIFAFGGINFDRAQDTVALALIDDTRTFAIPDTGYIQSGFGWRWGQRHNAVDICLKNGDTVVSAFDGIVRYAGWNSGGYGYLVIIRHYNGLETYYAHLSKLKCTFHQEVKAGEIIGLGGSTGRSYAPHLHFEVRYKDNPIDPTYVFDFKNRQLQNDTLVLTPKVFDYIGKRSNYNLANNSPSTVQASTDGIHYVRNGDTLWAISRMYGVSIQNLCSINGITETTTLQVGQKIRTR